MSRETITFYRLPITDYPSSITYSEMILSRRQTHFFAFSALVILLPLCFIAGIALRPNYISSSNPVPVELLERAGFAVTPNVETIASTEIVAKGITLKVKTGFDDRDRLMLAVQPTAPILRPDLLIYWETVDSAPEELSETALLLGSLSGDSSRQFSLPDEVRESEGYLILYNQVQQKLVAAFSLPIDLLKG